MAGRRRFSRDFKVEAVRLVREIEIPIPMGSLVNKDVPPGVTSMGNPVRFFQKVEVPAELVDGHAE